MRWISSNANPWCVEQNGKLYLPVDGIAPDHSAVAKPANDSMELDDTKDKVYIHNLDAELSDIESDEEKLIFIPDIEKKLAKIPRSVLTGQNPPIKNTAMVLYNVPSSLSVPKEQDNVRRAIIESRERSREKQEREREHQAVAQQNGHVVNSIGLSLGDHIGKGVRYPEDSEKDEDAMDIE